MDLVYSFLCLALSVVCVRSHGSFMELTTIRMGTNDSLRRDSPDSVSGLAYS